MKYDVHKIFHILEFLKFKNLYFCKEELFYLIIIFSYKLNIFFALVLALKFFILIL